MSIKQKYIFWISKAVNFELNLFENYYFENIYHLSKAMRNFKDIILKVDKNFEKTFR
jgi:hypothetical protein